jgi:hypothetical protein
LIAMYDIRLGPPRWGLGIVLNHNPGLRKRSRSSHFLHPGLI